MLPAKRNKKNSPSLLKRTMERFKAQEEVRKIEAIKPRYTHHKCASSGETYFREWRKERSDGLYIHQRAITNMREESGPLGRKGIFGVHQNGAESVDLSEFSWHSEPCAICGDDSSGFFCDHGYIVCGARSTFTRHGKLEIFKCHSRCGTVCTTFGIPRYVPASNGQQGGTNLLSGGKAKAFPKPTLMIGKK